MCYKDWFVDSGIIAQGSSQKDFERIHHFQSMRLHKEAFRAIVQTNVERLTENVKNFDAVVSSKLIELRKSLSPALFDEILKLEAFKDIKQHTVNTKLT